MGIFDSTINDIILGLKDDSNLSDISFSFAFPSKYKTNPIKSILAVLSISSVEINDAAFSGYIGIKNDNETYGKLSSLDVSIRIYAPFSMGGEACVEAFSRICDSLFCGTNDYHIKSASCKRVEYDKNMYCFTLDCTLKINMFIGTVNDDTSISSITVKGVI